MSDKRDIEQQSTVRRILEVDKRTRSCSVVLSTHDPIPVCIRLWATDSSMSITRKLDAASDSPQDRIHIKLDQREREAIANTLLGKMTEGKPRVVWALTEYSSAGVTSLEGLWFDKEPAFAAVTASVRASTQDPSATIRWEEQTDGSWHSTDPVRCDGRWLVWTLEQRRIN